MTILCLSPRGPCRPRRGYTSSRTRSLLPIFLALGSAAHAEAQERAWSLLLEPVYIDAFGHDQHVLTVREIDLDGAPATDTGTSESLDTEGTVDFRFELQRTRGEWGFGIDGFWFGASQGRPSRTGAAGAPSGTPDRLVFDVANRSFASDDPAERLYFRVLGDTDLEVWTIDAYGIRTLAETPRNRLRLLFGLRNADFDNDFHAIAGIEDVSGSLFDSSSNYDRMIGPLLGLAGDIELRRSTIRAYVGQSVVFGSTQLTHTTGDFVGPGVSDTPSIFGQESFDRRLDVSVPITELRINWLRPIGERLSLGLATNVSVWSDVHVPPGAVPVAEDGGYSKNTIVFFGLGAAVELRF